MTSQNKTRSINQFSLVKATKDFDYKAFSKTYKCRSLYVYQFDDFYLIAASISKGFQKRIADMEQAEHIVEVTNTRSLHSARSLIEAILPHDDLDNRLVYKKAQERNAEHAKLYTQIRNGMELPDMLEDPHLSQGILKDPARYYAYYQMVHNL